jgi:hypothetical protein
MQSKTIREISFSSTLYKRSEEKKVSSGRVKRILFGDDARWSQHLFMHIVVLFKHVAIH